MHQCNSWQRTNNSEQWLDRCEASLGQWFAASMCTPYIDHNVEDIYGEESCPKKQFETNCNYAFVSVWSLWCKLWSATIELEFAQRCALRAWRTSNNFPSMKTHEQDISSWARFRWLNCKHFRARRSSNKNTIIAKNPRHVSKTCSNFSKNGLLQLILLCGWVPTWSLFEWITGSG